MGLNLNRLTGVLRGSSVVHVCVHNPRAFVGVIICVVICVFGHFNKSYTDCQYVIYSQNDILILKHFMRFELAVAAAVAVVALVDQQQ